MAEAKVDAGERGSQEFVTEADWIPEFWNYLLGLDRNDLIAELVQNDLDQRATRTVIAFEQDRIVCQGDGIPVDEGGWRRLRMIRGAGDSVPAKRGRIGVKNHGLKTAFTVGDEILLESDGLAIFQTLYANGPDNRPHPGASNKPTFSPTAPRNGCRVEIRYRTKDLAPPVGEAILLSKPEPTEFDELFRSACKDVPEQFAGIVNPETVRRYEIVLRHWRLGDVSFRFSCSMSRRITRHIRAFRRRCRVEGNLDKLPASIQEDVAQSSLPLDRRLKERLPDFYSEGQRLFVEVSWRIDRQGRPQCGDGRYRYPIGYPLGFPEALTGFGCHFNAPFVSDTERHRPARHDPTNRDLTAACEDLLVDIIRLHLAQKWGADGLRPLLVGAGRLGDVDRVKSVLSKLVGRAGLPTVSQREAASLAPRPLAGIGPAEVDRALAAKKERGRRYDFVIPALTTEEDRIFPPLVWICPSGEYQIDPRIDGALLRLLQSKEVEGWGTKFVTFDEDDAICRVQGQGNSCFSAAAHVDRELSDPLLTHNYLEVISATIQNGRLDSQKEGELRETILLPDFYGNAQHLDTLYAQTAVPLDIPGLKLPHILHPTLAGHPILRRKGWRRKKFTLTEFLKSDQLVHTDHKTRKQFWDWIRSNPRIATRADRSLLVELPIWPDRRGILHKLAALCEPKKSDTRRILGSAIRRPHSDVLESPIVGRGSGRRVSIRHLPTADELERWLAGHARAFPIGAALTARSSRAHARFESDLAQLVSDPAIARGLAEIEWRLTARAGDGTIQWRDELVARSRSTERLALPRRFRLVGDSVNYQVDRITPALREPTIEMLISALSEDAGSDAALRPRLKALLDIAARANVDISAVSQLPILLTPDGRMAPAQLALPGRRGDYWGEWKARLPVRSFSQDDQKRLLQIGVVPGTPTAELSREFFRWLSEEDSGTQMRHLPSVLRHFLHPHGPSDWAEVFTELPCIPVRSSEVVKLVSRRTALRNSIYLSDVRDMEDQVIHEFPWISLVVDRVAQVDRPVAEVFRKLGVKSLREGIGEPVQVHGNGLENVDKGALERAIAAFHLSAFRSTFRKRVAELGIEQDLVRQDWYDRASQIYEIAFATEVFGTYRLEGRQFQRPINAGLDQSSGVFWIRTGTGNPKSVFYEAVAAQLVFKTSAQPIHHLALERATELEIFDRDYGRPAMGNDEGDGNATGHDEPESTAGDSDSEIGEAIFGHSPFEPDPRRNIPKPGPIRTPSDTPAPDRIKGQSPHSAWPSDSTVSPQPIVEREHIEQLKRDHYASHCQACLCAHEPSELAPPGSYVEWEEVRRRVIEAHHVDPKSGGGARHAGNLVLLCKYHHDNFGRRLSRDLVVKSLQASSDSVSIEFRIEDGSLTIVTGLIAGMEIPDTGESLNLFFTGEHATYWLSSQTTQSE